MKNLLCDFCSDLSEIIEYFDQKEQGLAAVLHNEVAHDLNNLGGMFLAPLVHVNPPA